MSYTVRLTDLLSESGSGHPACLLQSFHSRLGPGRILSGYVGLGCKRRYTSLAKVILNAGTRTRSQDYLYLLTQKLSATKAKERARNANREAGLCIIGTGSSFSQLSIPSCCRLIAKPPPCLFLYRFQQVGYCLLPRKIAGGCSYTWTLEVFRSTANCIELKMVRLSNKSGAKILGA